MESAEMEKILNKMPGAEGQQMKAELVLEINMNHPIADKLKALYEEDKDKLGKYARILYSEACLISGVGVENPAEFAALVAELML